MANKSEDDYWYTSERASFNFEDEPTIDSMIDKSSNQKVNFAFKEDNITVENEYSSNSQQSSFPITSVMSPQCLERLLENTSKSAHQKKGRLFVNETIDNMLLDRPYSLEGFKSLESKTQLLDAAVDIADGNAILTVVLFLSKTLKKNLFYNLLSTRKLALWQYVNYLSLRLNTSELTDLLMLSGNSSVMGIKLFKILMKNTSYSSPNDILRKKIQTLYNNHFSRVVNDKDSQLIKNYMDLLEWQENAEKDTNMNGVFGKSVNTSLAMCCKHYWDKPEDYYCSPQKLSKLHGINERQLHWIFLYMKTSEKLWDEILKMFVKNNFFGTKKVLNSSLNAENMVLLLGEHEAPVHVLETFASLMEDTEKSLNLAIKFKCHRHVINHYVSQKDRQGLMTFKSKVPVQSEAYFLIENALSGSTKWKN